MKIYCRPKPQAVEIRELDSHDCLLDSRLGRQGYVNKTSMNAAPAAENPTLKKGCEETHQSFFTALSVICLKDYSHQNRLPIDRNSGANTSDTTVISLIRMLMDGPDVSLNGSPTVSPTTAA
jgi:hypothetical protein